MDLLGEFGQIEWLGSLLIVVSYNLLFVLSVSYCIATKFTASVREELFTRYKVFVCVLNMAKQLLTFRLKGFVVSLVSKEAANTTCPTWPNSPIQAATSPINSASSAKLD